jgi:hypothetical protein
MAPGIMKDNGGRLLTEIRPMALWAILFWEDGTESLYQEQSLRCDVDQFFLDILDSPYIQELSQVYSRPGNPISAGPFLGTRFLGIKTGGPKDKVFDSMIQTALKDDVVAGILPWPTEDTCYFVFIPTDANVIQADGSTSRPGPNQEGFGGYHNWCQTQDGRTIWYCVIIPQNEDKDEITGAASHELVEVIVNPNPIDMGWTGPPDHQGRLQEIADICALSPPKGIHGHYVRPYLTDSESVTSFTCGPDSDQVPPGTSTKVYIWIEPSLTRLSCVFGSIIEGQSAFFRATAYYLGQPAIITSFDWSATSPGTSLIEPGGRQGSEYTVIILYGLKTLDIQVTVTTSLGCIVKATKTFTVITVDEANAEEKLCAEIAEIRKLAEIFRWPLPIPTPPPLWSPERDFSRYPLTLTEVRDIALLGERLVELALAAEPFARAQHRGIQHHE